MSNRQLPPIAKELIEAKRRIRDPEDWCGKNPGRDGQRRCAVWALADDDNLPELLGSKAFTFLSRASFDLFALPIVRVNDTLGHAAVMQMYKRAIEMAIKEGV